MSVPSTEAHSLLLDGRYRTAEVLGKGGVGEVRAGRDERLGRDVAIKLLRPEMAVLPAVAERFENEARMAARLVHPHIVAVFDFGVERGVPFLVMERLSGSTLADVLADGPLGCDEARELGLQLLGALAAAHDAGMIHRDIKPRNVLVGGPGCWKVGDFGIAKAMDAGAEANLTMAGMVVGTPAYLAPERLAGGTATVATDIYSVGVVLYQALTGRPPLDPGLPLQALASTVPRPLLELRPDVPAALAAVVTRAMARDPSARFASATEMAAALRTEPSVAGIAGIAGEKTVAFEETATPGRTELLAPPAVARAPRRGFRDRRVLATTGAAMALVLILSLVVFVSGGRQHSPAAPRATPAPAPVTTTVPATPRTVSTSVTVAATTATAGAGHGKGKKK